MTFQVLALSGGGYLGLFTASVLAHLEQRAGVPLARCFDLICGTSIGGILALGLAHEVPATQMRDQFVKHGQAIFSARPRPRTRIGAIWDVLWRSSTKSKYSDSALRKAIVDLLGENTRLGEARHRVIVPAVNMTKGSIQLFKTDHHQRLMRDYLLRSMDIALATSAAPTYFPLAEISGAQFADGGIFANAPDLCGIHEAVHFCDQSIEDLRLLSIGTTSVGYSLSPAIGRSLGALQWTMGGRLASTIVSAQQQLVDFLMRHQLGERYLRIDAQQSPEQARELGLDVATPAVQRALMALADGAYQEAAPKDQLQMMLAHRAAPPRFFHRKSNATHLRNSSQSCATSS